MSTQTTPPSREIASLTLDVKRLREALQTIADGIDEDDTGLTLRTVQKYARTALRPAHKQTKGTP